MCCFSRPVKSVSDTNIFARFGDKGRQFIVYSMKLEAREPLAMVLPIPVAADAKESDVRFINLEKYPAFFEDLNAGFPVPMPAGMVAFSARSKAVSTAPLKVEQVGSFEASFVPTPKDFARLDERFRLPPKSFEKLKGYEQFGFAVFKLKAGAQKVHPMAFEFRTASVAQLFFPTVHIHDGEVHERAGFDHALYCQAGPGQRLELQRWEESHGSAGQFMKVDQTRGVVLKDEHCYKRTLRGQLQNRDIYIKRQI